MSKTKIEWADMTINPVVGCSKCSPGCDNCYAERQAARLAKMPQTAAKYAGVVGAQGKWTGIVDFDVSCLLHLPKKPKRIFVGSLCDLFHDSVMDSHLEHIMGHIGLTRANAHHTFILLTKRPERMKEFFTQWKPYREMPNVWLGVTACNQQEADEKIPVLLGTPAAKRFVSMEPMLGATDISQWMPQVGHICHDGGVCHHGCQSSCHRLEMGYTLSNPTPYIDWIICGGETGPNARPMHPDWVRGLRDQCATADVPFFFKGWGEWVPAVKNGDGYIVHDDVDIPDGFKAKRHEWSMNIRSYRVGKRRAGSLLDGVEHNTFPSVVIA